MDASVCYRDESDLVGHALATLVRQVFVHFDPRRQHPVSTIVPPVKPLPPSRPIVARARLYAVGTARRQDLRVDLPAGLVQVPTVARALPGRLGDGNVRAGVLGEVEGSRVAAHELAAAEGV